MGLGVKVTGGDYQRTRVRYKKLINNSFRDTEIIFNRLGYTVSLTEIDANALGAWCSQWGQPRAWRWDELCHKQLTAIAKRFTIAIWDGNSLAGLCFGKVSRGRASISIAYIESNPAYSGNLKRMIAILATTAAKSLGKKVGATYVTMLDPVNARVEEHYYRIGYRKLRAFGDRNSMHININ